MIVYECIKKNARKSVCIGKEDKKNHCDEVLTENCNADFSMTDLVIKWWYEPEDCLCIMIK